MPYFHYSGRNSSGVLVSGDIDAGSADDVAAQLVGDSVTPIEIREVKARQIKAKKSPSSARIDVDPDASIIDRINAFLAGNKIELDELVMFARQM
ncbi:MAG: hypothetical protein IIC59_01475, partial [Proteobacteria bacterium]|nr:hypothetical protein [Pseudomonadota bacterium]